jgi:hypothetical protein
MEKSDEDAVIAAERALLDPAIRNNATKVAELLADDFEEVGQFGRRWTREEILDHIATETGAHTIIATNFAASMLAEGVVLLTYESEANGAKARRASIWHKTDIGWKLRYHQGTAVG